MIASIRACLCGASVFIAACSDPHNHANVPDQPPSPDRTAVIVLGNPTSRPPTAHEPLVVAAEEPAVAGQQVASPASPDADLVALVRDPRKSRWFPRSTQLLVTELQMLEALQASTPATSPDKPKLLRRLAENYVELKNAALRDKERVVGRRDISRGQVSNEVIKLDKLATGARTMAFKYYLQLRNNHPNHCQSPHPTDPTQSHGCLDDALYAIGLEYQEIDRFDEARKHYFQLIKDFPQSKWVAYAYLGFGELFFSEAVADPSKLDLAQKTYEQVLKSAAPDNDAYGFAHYRLAQLHHQKQDEATALAHFVQAIDFSIKFAALPSSKPLGNVARREIVPSYAAAGIPRKAESFFKRLTNDPSGTNDQVIGMLNDLVGIYLRDNKRVEAGDVCYAFSGGAGTIAACRSIQPSP